MNSKSVIEGSVVTGKNNTTGNGERIDEGLKYKSELGRDWPRDV